nr:hypothetical protein Iba_chr10aCG11700 [Ipomoea batatas]
MAAIEAEVMKLKNFQCCAIKEWILNLTSREMFGQYEASRTWRFTHVRDISRSVSSLAHEQFDISKDAKSGHEVAAERIAASESL